VVDGIHDNKPGEMNRMFVPGNIVVIKIAEREYAVFAHLKQNSVRVKVGDKVARGATISLCGNSGNSSEPHLHFQMQNTPFFEDESSTKVSFEKLTVKRDGSSRNKKRLLARQRRSGQPKLKFMKTKEKQPTDGQWKRLYELAAELKKLAPWGWMDETQIFGVENPDTKQIGFVSPMGMLGEHLSLGVYLGAEGLYGFWDYQTEGHEADPLALLEIPQLQVSFENRESVEKRDREVMSRLGLKFRGRQSYPLFRSIRPGFLPWFVTADEAQMLIYAIEQTLQVAPRVRENTELLNEDDNSETENEIALVRVAEKRGGELVWRDEIRVIAPPNEMTFAVKLPTELIDELKSFPQAKNLVLEIALFRMPNPIGEKGKRPYFPKMLMLADARNGMILGFQLLQPKDTDAENYLEIVRSVFAALEELETRPQEIRVAADALFDLLKGSSQELNIKLRQTDELPAIEAAQREMFGFFGGDFPF
jgi:hypothetical protein